MATGSGKTRRDGDAHRLAGAQQAARPPGRAASRDAFLIVTPGITIRDRLRVLLPDRSRQLLPPARHPAAGSARAARPGARSSSPTSTRFLPRETRRCRQADQEASWRAASTSPFTETPDQMVRRVCRELGDQKHIVVINDEAHHCYRRQPARRRREEATLSGRRAREAEKRDEEARVWISGLEAVHDKIGIRAIYDLSATPFFLRGSGYSGGHAVPVGRLRLLAHRRHRVRHRQGAARAGGRRLDDRRRCPTYRDLWPRIRETCRRRAAGATPSAASPSCPRSSQGALHSLYGNYEKAFTRWEANAEAQARGLTPPVFIVVCNNTNVSKLVFDYDRRLGEAGWPTAGRSLVPGQLAALQQRRVADRWPDRAEHDPDRLASSSSRARRMSAEFKKIAAARDRGVQGRVPRALPRARRRRRSTDEDLLREVMNTVGKPGKLGEHVTCVVSVSMLTEGWDANTVTHILGVRAFGTQLLCEQVVGRGLRRDELRRQRGRACSSRSTPRSTACRSRSSRRRGSARRPEARPTPATRVRALEERIACEITFPRLIGYRYELAGGTPRRAEFTDDSRLRRSRPPTSRPGPRTRRSSARRASTRWTTSRTPRRTRSPSCWPS